MQSAGRTIDGGIITNCLSFYSVDFRLFGMQAGSTPTSLATESRVILRCPRSGVHCLRSPDLTNLLTVDALTPRKAHVSYRKYRGRIDPRREQYMNGGTRCGAILARTG